MPPYKPKPPTSPNTRPPRLRQINEDLMDTLASNDIWKAFARSYVPDRRKRGYKAIFGACSMAHQQAEMAHVCRQVEPDRTSFRKRANDVAKLSERLLAALMPEVDELVPKGTPTAGVDGLAIDQRARIIATIEKGTLELYLRQCCVPDLADAFSRPDGTAQGHPVFGASDPVNVGSLLKQLALLHRRAVAAEANPQATYWGEKQPNAVFLGVIGLHVADLQPILGAGGETRYSTNRGVPAGWLPDFMKAAEAHAIQHGVKGLVSAASNGTIKKACEVAVRQM